MCRTVVRRFATAALVAVCSSVPVAAGPAWVLDAADGQGLPPTGGTLNVSPTAVSPLMLDVTAPRRGTVAGLGNAAGAEPAQVVLASAAVGPDSDEPGFALDGVPAAPAVAWVPELAGADAPSVPGAETPSVSPLGAFAQGNPPLIPLPGPVGSAVLGLGVIGGYKLIRNWRWWLR